ncbi:MAG: aldehyde dehydrogenase (NADP(+)), partial [Actinomadura sp.]
GEQRGKVAAEATADEVAAACRAADAARAVLAAAGIAGRAALLREMAAGLEGAADELVEVSDAESALGEPRLRGEVARTAFQLRLFADALEEGSWLGVTIDPADPDAAPAPRPDLRRMMVPLGVVAVFGASNFPLAFSVPGGDTASALAAGCPVVAKAHPAHPDLSERCARILRAAAQRAGLPADVIQIVHGQEAGAALVSDPHVKAVGFTGSARGGRALFDIARSRPEPIPFYGELGSLNPVVVTPAAAAERAADIATGLTGSFTLGTGQFCTKPGLVFVPADAAGDRLVDQMARSVSEVGAAAMLTDGIRAAFRAGLAEREALAGVRVVASGDEADGDRAVSARLLAAPATLLTDEAAAALLLDECFGPVTVLASYSGSDELLAALDRLPGSLTGTVHTGAGGDEVAAAAGVRLSGRVGRVVWNGYPTGVAVTWAMQHGGPYPSSTEAATTSVGTAAMQRFLRPVTYQSTPPELLPEELRDDNPLNRPRRVDGRLER